MNITVKEFDVFFFDKKLAISFHEEEITREEQRTYYPNTINHS